MYEALVLLLLLELAGVGVLVAPLSAATRRDLVRAVSPLVPSLASPARYLFLSLSVAALYCLLRLARALNAYEAASAASKELHASRLHRAQRDALLCGGATLLLLAGHRLFELHRQVDQLSVSEEALTRQAEGAAAAYAAARDESNALKKARPSAAGASQAGSGEEEELAIAHTTIAALRERNSSLLAARDAASKDAEALKRQAKGLSDEYGRLLLQKESLENKLSDFELMFGDDVKKAK